MVSPPNFDVYAKIAVPVAVPERGEEFLDDLMSMMNKHAEIEEPKRTLQDASKQSKVKSIVCRVSRTKSSNAPGQLTVFLCAEDVDLELNHQDNFDYSNSMFNYLFHMNTYIKSFDASKRLTKEEVRDK